ncbi:MAG: hypothetical protein DMG65_11775 [Candidatus Angelobacter sp. Gp1-AA117]|nr:MAG: hypothetical protein DMG65_11775 [Candidatus Angelobacter sp. Gp1-AA117]
MAWGQLIQGTPEQSPPIQAVTPSGGDFSDVTKPDPKNIVPKDTIIIKGAWSSASDSKIPVPEGSSVSNNIFTDPYFGISYPLPPDWVQKYTPPPPSDTGRYVLSQISRADTYKGEARGSILFTAHDMFFTPVPAANARQYVNYTKNHLPEDYQLELKPTQTTIAGQPFTFFAYWSVVAQLHWYVLATEIRCHTVEIVLMNHDPKALEELVGDMDKKMKLPVEASSTGGTGGGNVPVCLKDYAQGENVAERVDPVLTVQRYNAIPVRIIINKEGKIRYIHFLSAYPEQEKTITDALKQWKFRPYEKNGQRLEVETGLMFGRPSLPVAPATPATTD